MSSTDDYLALVTSEHRDKPRYSAMIRALTSGFSDQINQLDGYLTRFDLDQAVGDQLDVIGQWVGVGRSIAVPLTGVYFTLDDANLGFDHGNFLGQFDSTAGLTSLDDASYRLLIRAKIGANKWDGTLGALQTILDSIFVGSGVLVFVHDNQDMSMYVGLTGTIVSAVQKGLLNNGYLVPKPEGVMLTYYFASIGGTPSFGADLQNTFVAGFDTGAFT